MADFVIGQMVEKFSGDYGGPGRVVDRLEPEPGKLRYVVAFEIAAGFGEFYHILNPSQLRALETSSSRRNP